MLHRLVVELKLIKNWEHFLLLQLVINSIANASIIAYNKFSNMLMHKLKIPVAIITINTFVNLDLVILEN